MAREGVDALLLTQYENVRYVSGLYEVGWIVPSYFYAVVLPRDENRPAALFVAEGYQILTQASWIQTVVRWDYPVGFYTGEVGAALVESLAQWMQQQGLDQGCIATELGAHFRMGLSISAFDSLREALPDSRWRDCGPVMWPVRSVKSEEEIRRIREACRISCLGVRAGFKAMYVGASERELANVMSTRMHAEGSSKIGFLSLYAGPDRAMWADSDPRRDMVLQPGSLLQFDGGCTYDGYFCDFKRMASMGEPTAEQRKYYDLARASHEAAIAVVEPGVPTSEVYHTSQRVIEEAGLGDFVAWCQKMSWTSIGHNVGLEVHEMPGISINNHAPLKPNMVVAIEPFVWHGGHVPYWECTGKYGLEDIVLVTETGHEVLTSESLISHDLWVAAQS
jgi:Xaa-Pro aminopeptidase